MMILTTLDLALDIYSSGFSSIITQLWYLMLSVVTSILNHCDYLSVILYCMILLITKLLLSLVTFVSSYPHAQDSTLSQFSHYKLQSTHSDTLFWKHTFYLEQNSI